MVRVCLEDIKSYDMIKNPVCTREGHVFDLEAIVPFLQAKKMVRKVPATFFSPKKTFRTL